MFLVTDQLNRLDIVLLFHRRAPKDPMGNLAVSEKLISLVVEELRRPHDLYQLLLI